MHKKLEAELISLAHNILQMKNREDTVALKEKARVLYERLSVLTFVDEYLNTTPNAPETKAELISEIENAIESQPIKTVEKPKDKSKKETVKPSKIVEIENKKEENIAIEVKEELIEQKIEIPAETVKKELTMEEEFKDAVSADVTIDLFAKIEEKKVDIKTSLNDKLQTNVQIGLNDRIAFVKHLFNHSQADFNRVLSQLNSFKTEKEALNFIKKMVKPDYDWSEKEEYEERFIALIERRFL